MPVTVFFLEEGNVGLARSPDPEAEPRLHAKRRAKTRAAPPTAYVRQLARHCSADARMYAAVEILHTLYAVSDLAYYFLLATSIFTAGEGIPIKTYLSVQ
jgi:hypothetical protein